MVVTAQPDVFLSHSSADKVVVRQIAQALQLRGVRVWFDGQQLVAGESSAREHLSDALRSARSCAVLVGSRDIQNWQRAEVDAVINRASRDPSFRVFLVQIPGAPEPFPFERVDAFLAARPVVIDLRAGIEDLAALAQLERACLGRPLDDQPVIEREESPYRGLDAFDEADQATFHGRVGDVTRLVAKLGHYPCLAVVGASGVGKSSLVKAGLVPALRRGALQARSGTAGSDTWSYRLLTPGPRPIRRLAALLVQETNGSIRDTVEILTTDPLGLHTLTATGVAGRPLCLVVDQAEEVFTASSVEERAIFLDNLAHAPAAGACTIILTIRADFYGHWAAHRPFATTLAANQCVIAPLDGAGLRAAIERPALGAGRTLEPGLVEAILRDLPVGEPSALPMLSYAMLELWRMQRGNVLTLGAYHHIGGVRGALIQRAESEWSQLDEKQQACLRLMMSRLCHIAEGVEPSRRRVAIRDLVSARSPKEEVAAVVGRFTEARLLTAERDGDGDEFGTITVAHEALIREWPRLRGWLAEDVERLELHQRLTEAASAWRSAADMDGKAAELWRGVRLARALELRAAYDQVLNDTEHAFLDASDEHQLSEQHARRRRRNVLRALVLGVLLVPLAVLIAWTQRGAALRADRAADVAEANRLASTSNELLDADRQMSLLLAAELVHRNSSPETEGALLNAIARPTGPRQFFTVRPPGATEELDWASAVALDDGSVAVRSRSGAGVAFVDPRSGWVTGEIPLARPGAPASVSSLEGRSGTSLVLLTTGASPGARSALGLLDAASGNLESITRERDVVSVVAGPGDELVIADAAGAVAIGTRSGEVPLGQFTGIPLDLAISPDGSWIVASATGGVIGFEKQDDGWSPAYGLLGEGAGAERLAFRPGRPAELYAAGTGGQIRRWDLQASTIPSNPFDGLDGTIEDIVFSTDGSRLFVAGRSETMQLLDLTQEPIQRSSLPTNLEGNVQRIAALDEDEVMLGGELGAVVVDVGTARVVGRELPPLMDEPRAIDVVAADRATVAVDDDGVVRAEGDGAAITSSVRSARRLWVVDSTLIIESGVRQIDSGPLDVSTVREGTSVVLASNVDAIDVGERCHAVWAVGSELFAADIGGCGRTPPALEPGRIATDHGPVFELALDADESRLAVAFGDGVVQWMSLTNSERAETVAVESRERPTALGFVGDRLLVVGFDGDQPAVAIDTSTGDLRELPGNGDAVWWVVDDTALGRFYLGGQDGLITLWDARTLRRIGQPLIGVARQIENDESAAIFGLQLREPGVLLALAGTTLLEWELRPERWVAVACQAAGRSLTEAERARFGLDGPSACESP
ncbi:MAG: TIR domain-containing protein [Acidimicrobiia bacterium]